MASINAILVPFWEISGTVSALSYQRLPDGNEIEKRINRQVALFTTCGARDQEIHNAVMKYKIAFTTCFNNVFQGIFQNGM